MRDKHREQDPEHREAQTLVRNGVGERWYKDQCRAYRCSDHDTPHEQQEQPSPHNSVTEKDGPFQTGKPRPTVTRFHPARGVAGSLGGGGNYPLRFFR